MHTDGSRIKSIDEDDIIDGAFTVPDGTSTIEERFYSGTSLKKLIIPNSVLHKDFYTFHDFNGTGIETIVIGNDEYKALFYTDPYFWHKECLLVDPGVELKPGEETVCDARKFNIEKGKLVGGKWTIVEQDKLIGLGKNVHAAKRDLQCWIMNKDDREFTKWVKDLKMDSKITFDQAYNLYRALSIRTFGHLLEQRYSAEYEKVFFDAGLVRKNGRPLRKYFWVKEIACMLAGDGDFIKRFVDSWNHINEEKKQQQIEALNKCITCSILRGCSIVDAAKKCKYAGIG